jgi:hypothetical protein
MREIKIDAGSECQKYTFTTPRGMITVVLNWDHTFFKGQQSDILIVDGKNISDYPEFMLPGSRCLRLKEDKEI